MQTNHLDRNKLREYINTLLERMVDTTGTYHDPLYNNADYRMSWEGRQTPGEIAMKEGSSLLDIRSFDILREIVQQTTKSSERPWKSRKMNIKEKAYYLLAYLFTNTKERGVLEFMLERLQLEKNIWLLQFMLGTLGSDRNFLPNGIPEEFDLSPIINLTEHHNSLVWSEAFRCLNNANSSKVEDLILKMIERLTDTGKLVEALCVLERKGTKKSIAILKELPKRNKELEPKAVLLMQKLGSRADLSFFVDKLENSRNPNTKINALEAVIQYGDEDQIPVVIKRVKQFVSRERKRSISLWGPGETELTQAMGFLSKYADKNKAIPEFYTFLMTKKINMLGDDEMTWMEKNKVKFI